MQSRLRCVSIVVVVATAMTCLFWWPLYGGAGFIGGDLYPYYFPQKAFYADCLKLGRFPLWNDLCGFGYPIMGESQTGAAYPFHLVTYLSFGLNTAYNVEHLLHYFICFIGTWLFARRLGLIGAGSHLAAVVFTYGWFPPRACLEWAILTGAWLPVALWCTESFLQTRTWRYAIGLSAVLGLQLLAGHFHLAFITQLLVVTWFTYGLWRNGRYRITSNPAEQATRSKQWVAIGFVLALAAGAGLAAIQILPTWELKQRSSRTVTGGDYDPAYGHLPPFYVSQLIVPWCWYGPLPFDEDNIVRDTAEFFAPWFWFCPFRDSKNPNQLYDLDQAIQRCRFGALGAGTNKVEAHCYCGLVPICLAFWATVLWIRRRFDRSIDPSQQVLFEQTGGYWLIAGALALTYATGLLMPIGLALPGFSFFRGPGRYGIVTTLAVALFAGHMLSRLLPGISHRFGRFLLLTLVFGSTCGDLWLVSRMVKYTVMTNPPRIAFREASDVRRILMAESKPPRLLAPGANVCNLLGVSCVPWYLGIAPAEYVDPHYTMPDIPKPTVGGGPTTCPPDLLAWLSRSGVTHVLNYERLDQASWHAELIWSGVDQFLNRAWGRDEPIYLYRFQSAGAAGEPSQFPGRAYATDENCEVIPLDWKFIPAETRKYELRPDRSGKTEVTFTELQFPGWTVRQGQSPLTPKSNGMFRAAEVNESDRNVVWDYQPRSVFFGALVSLFTTILLAFIAHLRFWHPMLIDRMLKRWVRVNDRESADGRAIQNRQ